VYDDVERLEYEPYLGASEFYLEYGDFDNITAPANVYLFLQGVKCQQQFIVL
jgi:hypothetical protein